MRHVPTLGMRTTATLVPGETTISQEQDMSHAATSVAIPANTDDLIARGGISFTGAEALALEHLRLRYREDHDLFSPQELAQLRFLRWLVRTQPLVA
jgi:hypothetical protein